jgi:hypothetical protein
MSLYRNPPDCVCWRDNRPAALCYSAIGCGAAVALGAPRQGRTQGAGPLLFARPRHEDGTRPGICPAFFRLGGEPLTAHRTSGRSKKVTTTTRKPMLSFRLFGLFLLRTAQRTFLGLLL